MVIIIKPITILQCTISRQIFPFMNQLQKIENILCLQDSSVKCNHSAFYILQKYTRKKNETVSGHQLDFTPYSNLKFLTSKLRQISISCFPIHMCELNIRTIRLKKSTEYYYKFIFTISNIIHISMIKEKEVLQRVKTLDRQSRKSWGREERRKTCMHNRE